MLVRNAFTHDTRVEREAATLRDAGYAVTVVAEAGPGLASREDRGGIRVIRVPNRGPRVPGLRFVAHVLRLAVAVNRTQPEILHAHDTDALQSVGLVALARGIPYVYDAHELWLDLGARGRSAIYGWAARLYFGLVERVFVPRAAAVLVANPPEGPELARRYHLREVLSVPNYPADALERDEPDRGDLRTLPGGEGIPADAPLVMYVGGLARERGIEQLVAAMTEVPSARLVFLGAAGGLEPEVRRLVAELGIADRAHFIPPVPSGDVVRYTASGTVGVLATQPTCLNNVLALPNKIFQYMAAGIPTVAPDYPHLRELLEGDSAGVVVDVTRPSELAAAIRGYLHDPDRARRDGASARRAVQERYRWTMAATRLLDAYRRAEEARR
jgi:glycosyltransferase involved in cell wall biosynthesis